jgi:glycosyltransferase involved in cell wall biosynthesis
MVDGDNRAAGEPARAFDFSFVAPAYNESSAIEPLVRCWEGVIEGKGIRAEIVIVNDGSTDDTGEILRRLSGEFPNLRLVEHRRNCGYGSALADAIRHARGRWIVTLDSDGQSDIAEYAHLHEVLVEGGFDAVTGYRRPKQDRFTRVLADRVLNLIVRVLFGMRLKDTNCSLKIYRAEPVQSIEIESRGYSAPTEILLKLHALGYRIGERQTTHHPRAGGSSALRLGRTSWDVLVFLIRLRRKIKRYQRGEVARL